MDNCKIDSIATLIIDLPLRRLQRFSVLGTRSQSIVLIRIVSNSGIEGIGESVTPSGPWWGGESVETIKTIIDQYLAPCVIGENAFDLQKIMGRMDSVVHANPFAKAGVEMALLDIVGKSLDQPVYNLLGGKLRNSLPVSWPLATGDAEAEIEEAQRMLAGGFCQSFKLKMGALDPEKDVARAVTIAQALDGRARVRVDPNEMWDETTAKRLLPQLEEAGIELIEQPMPRWNLAASARLTSLATSSEIMLDEGVCTLRDMLEIIRLRAAGLISIKIMKMGGIRASKTIAQVAEASGVSVYMGTFLESSLGTAANMQLCATFGNLPYGGELIGPLLIAEDICQQAAQYENGELKLTTGPGLGVKLDEDKVRALLRDKSYSSQSAA